MRRLPGFPLLRAFEAAARHGSFLKAAGELHVTPSSVSHQVKELEELLGKPLFMRQHRRVQLTAEGRRLADRLFGVFDLISAACDEVAAATDAEVLTVHSAPGFATKWLSPRLRLFVDANPNTAITISSTDEPADLIRDRMIDVAISYGRAVRRDGLSVFALGMEEFAPLCAPSLLATASPANEVLYRRPLIYLPLSRIGWEQWFTERQLNVPNGRRLSFDRASLGIAAAVNGMGIVLETLRLAEVELASGSLVKLDESDAASMWAEAHFLSVRTSEMKVPRVRSFASWLLGVVNLPFE